MKEFRADLHIHTVLSPCGSLEMSPKNIVSAALNAKLDFIAITDHNTTKQAAIIKEYALENGLFVICGAEVCTKEEVHCVALFETDEARQNFQLYLDEALIKIKNKPEKFGEQVLVDVDEMILEEEENLLIISIDKSIQEVEEKVHALNGIFFPAHVDRPMNGIFKHLGFVPDDLNCDAFGISMHADRKYWQKKLKNKGALLKNSDAHYLDQIGKVANVFTMNEISFSEIKWALKQVNGRTVRIEND